MNVCCFESLSEARGDKGRGAALERKDNEDEDEDEEGEVFCLIAEREG